jgi:NAD(P)-dependent dehydrogenase (short-subunit alcohol dehydrogenase family)
MHPGSRSVTGRSPFRPRNSLNACSTTRRGRVPARCQARHLAGHTSDALSCSRAERGVTVNAIAPSTIDAPLLHAAPAEVRERLVASVPVGRIGKPADVAWAVLIFAADETSFVTGQTLYVCGGRSLAAY